LGDAKLHGNIKPGIPSWKPITGKTDAGYPDTGYCTDTILIYFVCACVIFMVGRL